MTEGDIHKSKITRPLPRGTYPRERLFRMLDETRDRPVTWVSGPPGSGKTTLVSGYLEKRRLPVLWYRVDKGDADPATFFHYLGVATQAALPRKRKPLPGPVPSDPSGIAPFARRYFTELFGRFGSRLALVFDEWENATPGTPAETAVREGIRVLPKGFRAILISREEPSPDFIREVDSRRLGTIGWRELRLTLEETAEIARMQRRDVSAETIRYLHGKAGGWATGVILLLEQAQRDGIEPHHIGRMTPEEIVEYLAGDMFRDLDAETRMFLVRAAFLPRMTARAAEELTGDPRAARRLSYMNRHNLFTEVHPGEEPVYEFHSLFREFLLHHAKENLSPEEACETRRRAAVLLEASGQTGEAVDLLRQCGDFHGACRVIRKEAPSLARQGRCHTLGEWIMSLPEDLRSDDPWLLYWTGICSQLRNPAESRAAFERTFELFSRAGEEAGVFLSWSGVVDAILFQWDDFRSLDRWIGWLDRRVADGASFPTTEIEARVSASMAGALHRRRPEHPEIRVWIERAMSASRAAGDENLLLRSLVHAANHHHWTGDRGAASHALEEIRHLSRASSASPAHAILGMSVEASTLLWADADRESALRIIAEGIDAAGQLGTAQWDHLFHAAGAYAALLAGDWKAAGESLEKLKAALPGSRRFAECQYEYLCAWHHLLRGDHPGAAAHAGQALANAEAAGAVFPEILCRLAAANIAGARGEHKQAKAHLLGIGDRILSTGNRMFEFMERLTAARSAFGSGDESGGLSALRAGMELGRKQGYINMFWWWEPEAMTSLCMKALEAGIEPDYVLELVRKRGLSPPVPPMEIEEWPWRVRIYTLGRFDLVRDGRRLSSTGKAQQKPLRLLKAIIALGGRDVPREKLSDAVWPEADGDRALDSLSVNVRRLRRLLGDEKSVLVAEGRFTLSNRICWVDAWAFKRIFARAERLRHPADTASGSAHPSVPVFLKALSLYRGDFLEQEKDTPWPVSLRERLRTKFLRCVMDAGRSLEAVAEWEDALACYRKGLEVDDLHEEFYRRIMNCHHLLGRRSEAEDAYKRCRRTLRAVLGADPSPETEALLSSIRKPVARTPEAVG